MEDAPYDMDYHRLNKSQKMIFTALKFLILTVIFMAISIMILGFKYISLQKTEM